MRRLEAFSALVPLVLCALSLTGQTPEAATGFLPPAGMAKAAAEAGACAVRTSGSIPTVSLWPLARPANSEKLAGSRPEASGSDIGGDGVTVRDQSISADRPDGCDRVLPVKTKYAATDRAAFYRLRLSGVSAGDVVRWEWSTPDGSIYKTNQLVLDFSGRGCVWDGMAIAGQEAAAFGGDWHVRAFVNGQPLESAVFALSADGGASADGRLTRQILNSVFSSFVRLGFATGRAVCSGGALLSPEAVALSTADLNSLIDGLSPALSVVRFDLARVHAVRDALPGMPGDQMAVELVRLYEVLVAPIRDARLSCQQGTGPLLLPPAVDNLVTAGLRIGIAAAVAVSCVPCSQPLPDDAAAFIRAQLDAASAELRAYSACLGGFDFGQFNVPLGAPAVSLASYVAVSAIHNAISQSILANDCSCDLTNVSGGTGTIRGTVRNASNGLAISGATVSLVGTSVSATAAADGGFTLANVPAGSQTIRAVAQGFIASEVLVAVASGQTLTQNLSLSPTLATGELRITLNWVKDASRRPDDLDMHLAGPSPDGASCFHIYYSNLGSLTASPFAQLEVDNIRVSASPPTETIRVTRLTPGIYRFYVHNYSGETADGLGASQATIQVVGPTGQLFSQSIPTGAGTYWSVFTMNGTTGAITRVNMLSTTEPSRTPCR